MTLGVALFASVVLILLVYNKPFRKVFFWLAGICVVGYGLFLGGVFLYDYHEVKSAERKTAQQAAEQEKAISKCMKRFPNGNLIDTALLCDKNPDAAPIPSAAIVGPKPPFDPTAPYQVIPKPTLKQGIVVKFAPSVLERERQLIITGLRKHLNRHIYEDESYLLIIEFKDGRWGFIMTRTGSHFSEQQLVVVPNTISGLLEEFTKIRPEGETE
jgi:hypothetical protein